MKCLVVGIDGGSAPVFDMFDMPFWSQLRSSAHLFDTTEDLLQRGWARILSGAGAEVTAATYVRPVLGEIGKFRLAFGYKDLAASPGFTPIWRFAEDAGYGVGMMNVPTTYPAQGVEGFYIAGGGGGINQGGIPPGAVYPSALEDVLLGHKYIFDVRLGAESFSSLTALTEQLVKMMNARTAAFVDLARTHRIGFGFLAFRATAVLLYLAMSEIEALANNADVSSSHVLAWRDRLYEHFHALDLNLKFLFDSLGPEHFVMVSDHDIVPWRWKSDTNVFLEREGYARYRKSARRLARNVGRLAFRRRFREATAGMGLTHLGGIVSRAGANLLPLSEAFGGWYNSGIYINDERFAAKVDTDSVHAKANEIVERFNADSTATAAGLTATHYRRHFSGAPNAHLLPDIKIDHDGSAFFVSDGIAFVRPNEWYGPVTSLANVGGMHTGQKGTKPLLLIGNDLLQYVDQDDPIDLTLPHTIVRRLFQNS